MFAPKASVPDKMSSVEVCDAELCPSTIIDFIVMYNYHLEFMHLSEDIEWVLWPNSADHVEISPGHGKPRRGRMA
jgi:hypothetical protein